MSQTDEQLMHAVGTGDAAAFAKLVHRHQRTAWNVAYRFLGQAQEAEDVVQDAFLKLLKAAPRYRPTALFRTYLTRVVSRLCMDRTRKKAPLYVDRLPESAVSGNTAVDRLLEEERAEAVRLAVTMLPPAQRMAVVLRYYEELGYAGIAAALGTTAKGAERLLARGRATLRKALGDRLTGETAAPGAPGRDTRSEGSGSRPAGDRRAGAV
ncbi:MAG: sigma-70 family RNA polymerase sigma factor [Kiritimatiellae bacterium]|nr:sigma-70 family RNA polymerase sigma factor [Kiritimatiellia bacterium]